LKILFLDESGDHNLTRLDPLYPLFVLAGCVMSNDYHDQILTPILNDFKRKLLKKQDILLHYVD